MPATKISFEVVRKIGMTLPGVQEGRLHGAPSLTVCGRLLTCPALHSSAEPNSLVVRIGFEDRAHLIAAEPAIYYVTEHYANYSGVLVRLARIDRTSLSHLLDMAWKFVSSRKKAKRTL